MVESSRSITAAVITAPNANQRHLPLLVPAPPAGPVSLAPAAGFVLSRFGVMVSDADDIGSSVVSPVSHHSLYRNEIFCSKTIRTEWFVPVLCYDNFHDRDERTAGRPQPAGQHRQAGAARPDERPPGRSSPQRPAHPRIGPGGVRRRSRRADHRGGPARR